MRPNPYRYSVYLRPIAYFIDLALIILFARLFDFGPVDYLYFGLFTGFGWILLSLNSKFYEIYRFTKVTRIISLSFLQIILFSLIVFSFFGIFQEMARPLKQISAYLTVVFLTILAAKLSIYFLLQHYRKYLGGNYRSTIIIGNSSKAQQLAEFFDQHPNYGYHLKKTFPIEITPNTDTRSNDKALKDGLRYIMEEEINEIYCSMASVEDHQVKMLVDFADNNLKVLKFIPDSNKDIFTKQFKLDYYDYIPVLSRRNLPTEEPVNKFAKRVFDIIFSSLVIIFLLSWLTPLLAIIIKLNSRGPVFFRQLRNGLDYEEFYCYKFRSMKVNKEANTKLMSKNDSRVTSVGEFLRKTSMDELPQFFNVFIGNMSTVGPRPHMLSVSDEYAENFDKFMVRHLVKPGITGLAQVSGYRGEMETDQDVINRLKYDVFYVENWSLMLDIKIIIQTIFQVLKGDERSY